MRPTTLLRLSAVTMAVAYLTAVFLPSLPEGVDSDAQVAAHAEGATAALVIAGGYLLAVAGLAALVFAHLLSALLPRGHAAGHDAGHDVGSLVVRAAGSAYGTVVVVAAVMFAAVPMARAVGELPGQVPVEAYRVLVQCGFFALLVPGLLAAGVTMVGTWSALRGSATPPWVGVLGLVMAPVMLLGFAWGPQLLVPVWAVAVAFGLRVDAGPSVPGAERALRDPARATS
jgi:hypothetical protein